MGDEIHYTHTPTNTHTQTHTHTYIQTQTTTKTTTMFRMHHGTELATTILNTLNTALTLKAN